MNSLLDGITARRVSTSRLGVQILECGQPDGIPVVFVHGNVSSSLFWQSTMLAMPSPFRSIAVDLRGFGGSDPLPVDATRGLRDFADDLGVLFDTLSLSAVHLVGWSMGGGVVMQYLLDAPARIRSLTLVNPVSPYGFGGTRGLDGELSSPDAAGSGGGAANPDFVARLAAGDTSGESPLSPRNVLLAHYVKEGYLPPDLDAMVSAMLSTVTGDDNYPGDSLPTSSWPGFAPGDRGVLNALAPSHFRIEGLHAGTPKPPILWIRGTADVIVSDTSLYDLAYLGSIGAIPGWPGPDLCPPQPMVGQTRAFLDTYGAYTEIAIPDAGHAPHLDHPKEFQESLIAHLSR